MEVSLARQRFEQQREISGEREIEYEHSQERW